MTTEFYNEVLDALKDRSEWETRQSLWYRMRNGGVRRPKKPYPGAPDQWFPLGDTSVSKLKPFYISQLYNSETIASFVALRQQDASLTSAAAAWFDYKLKQQSNFEREIFVAIDKHLEGGFVPIKIRWDVGKKQLSFDTCDPLHVIVPKDCEEYKDADWLIHVVHLSEDKYRANPNYRQDDDFIKCIKGKGKADSNSGTVEKEQAVSSKEGIICGQDENQIVLWEAYTRKKGSRRLYLEVISPLKPTEPVRAEFCLPYNQGLFKDGDQPPFAKLRFEVKGKSYYDSRGVVEQMAPFETSLNKTWNTWLSWQDFHIQPVYKNTGQGMTPNPQNFDKGPGGILPLGLEPVEPPRTPIDLQESMAFTRAVAEDRIQIPDFGSDQHLPGRKSKEGDVTATEINAITAQSGQGNDVRARLFRLDLAVILQMAHSLLLQYDAESYDYVTDGEMQQVPREALHNDYLIGPNGSPDSWNKGQQMQKAVARYQLLRGNEFVDQGALTKSFIEADDSRLVKTLFRDPKTAEADQAEQQASEIVLMTFGFPAAVMPPDDDKTHLTTMAGFVLRRTQTGEPILPEQARLLLKHGGDHAFQLQQKKDPMARQIEQQMLPIIQQLSVIAAQVDPRDQAARNVVPMSPGGGDVPAEGGLAGAQQLPPPGAPQPQEQMV